MPIHILPDLTSKKSRIAVLSKQNSFITSKIVVFAGIVIIIPPNAAKVKSFAVLELRKKCLK